MLGARPGSASITPSYHALGWTVGETQEFLPLLGAPSTYALLTGGSDVSGRGHGSQLARKTWNDDHAPHDARQGFQSGRILRDKITTAPPLTCGAPDRQ